MLSMWINHVVDVQYPLQCVCDKQKQTCSAISFWYRCHTIRVLSFLWGQSRRKACDGAVDEASRRRTFRLYAWYCILTLWLLLHLSEGQGHPLNSTTDFETVREVQSAGCFWDLCRTKNWRAMEIVRLPSQSSPGETEIVLRGLWPWSRETTREAHSPVNLPLCFWVWSLDVWRHEMMWTCFRTSSVVLQRRERQRWSTGSARPLRICDKEIQRDTKSTGSHPRVSCQPEVRTSRQSHDASWGGTFHGAWDSASWLWSPTVQDAMHNNPTHETCCGGCWASTTSAVWRMDGLCVFTPPVRVLDTLFHQIRQYAYTSEQFQTHIRRHTAYCILNSHIHSSNYHTATSWMLNNRLCSNLGCTQFHPQTHHNEIKKCAIQLFNICWWWAEKCKAFQPRMYTQNILTYENLWVHSHEKAHGETPTLHARTHAQASTHIKEPECGNVHALPTHVWMSSSLLPAYEVQSSPGWSWRCRWIGWLGCVPASWCIAGCQSLALPMSGRDVVWWCLMILAIVCSLSSSCICGHRSSTPSGNLTSMFRRTLCISVGLRTG